MTEPIRDLANWYPLLPSGSMPSAAKDVLDVRVIVKLPAEDYAYQVNGVAKDMCSAVLDSFSSSVATVSVTLPDGVRQQMSIPVYVGRDAGPAPGGSYVVIAKTQPGVSAVDRRIHPDCLLFMQDAPTVTFMNRGSVSKIDARPGQHGGRQDGATGDPTPVSLNPLSFEDGYNVSVSVVDGSLVFTGAAGAGAGVFTSSPYSDVASLATTPGKGLRSINGKTGDVVITGSDVVDVSVDYSMPSWQNTKIITVTLQPKV